MQRTSVIPSTQFKLKKMLRKLDLMTTSRSNKMQFKIYQYYEAYVLLYDKTITKQLIA